MFKLFPDPTILLEIGVVSESTGKKFIVPLSGIIIISDIILLSNKIFDPELRSSTSCPIISNKHGLYLLSFDNLGALACY
jgi:hypothetical protein